MQLPNKLYSYKDSTLAFVPVVLAEIRNGHTSIDDLFQRVNPFLKEPTDFMAVMDCLYALRAIDLTEEGEVFICL